jgi:TolB-like protein
VDDNILECWKTISVYLKHSEKTCRYWAKEFGLPIHRIEKKPKARVYAYKDELDRWLAKRLGEPGFLLEKNPNKHRKKAQLFLILVSSIFVLTIIAIVFWQVLPFRAVKSPSIAILPFVDLSPEKRYEYLSHALTDNLIKRLANIQGIRVSAGGPGFSLQDKTDEIQLICKKLAVGNVLKGSIHKTEEKLVVIVQLYSAKDNYYLFSKCYECRFEDIFTIQDDIVQLIVKTLEPNHLEE